MICRSGDHRDAAPVWPASRRPHPTMWVSSRRSVRPARSGRVVDGRGMRVAGPSRERPADPVQHHGPAAEGSAALATDAGRAHLGAGVAHRARGRPGDRRDPLATAAVETEHDVLVEQAQRGAEGGQQDRGGPRIPRRRGVEPVVAEHLVRALLELGAEDVAQRHGAPAGGRRRRRSGRRRDRGSTAARASGAAARPAGAPRGRGTCRRRPRPRRRAAGGPTASRWRTAIDLSMRWVMSLAPMRMTAASGWGTTSRALATWTPRSPDTAPTTATLVRRTRRPAKAETPVARMAPMVCRPTSAPRPAALLSPRTSSSRGAPGPAP